MEWNNLFNVELHRVWLPNHSSQGLMIEVLDMNYDRFHVLQITDSVGVLQITDSVHVFTNHRLSPCFTNHRLSPRFYKSQTQSVFYKSCTDSVRVFTNHRLSPCFTNHDSVHVLQMMTQSVFYKSWTQSVFYIINHDSVRVLQIMTQFVKLWLSHDSWQYKSWLSPDISPCLSSPVQSSPVQSRPVQSIPVQSSAVQCSPVQSSVVQSSPVQSSPAQSSPVRVLQHAVLVLFFRVRLILPHGHSKFWPIITSLRDMWLFMFISLTVLQSHQFFMISSSSNSDKWQGVCPLSFWKA